ncbi:hypothetical protein HHK36_026932 [Tetracentron sinense]|uniref:Uncharacterized protein n=1 Tax=Tetracentron sinense TaxID=13715 RepID=A0A834YM97_TETSI|nr:hypothetical protein HHK36_026932 [Tetracentron sinense]
MGCFLACFGSSKARKRRKRVNKILPGDQRHGSIVPLQPTVTLKQESIETPISPISELRYQISLLLFFLCRDKPEEQLSFSTRKKVTFNLNVKTCKEVSGHEITDQFAEGDEKKEMGNNEEKTAKASHSPLLSEDDSITSSMGSYPSNYRYQNCRNSDDEDEGIKMEESYLDDDEEDYGDDGDDDDNDWRVDQEESSESSSLSRESRTRGFVTPTAETEVNSQMPLHGSTDGELKTLVSTRNARDRSQYVHSVLNPVENLTQWKAIKARATSPLKHQKENDDLEKEPQIPFSSEPSFKQSPFSSEPSFKQSPLSFNPNFNYSKPPNQEFAVDTSLSNWLVSSETTPITKTSTIAVGTMSSEKNTSQRSNSPRSQEDRPILGALTIEELKQFSSSSSSRRSPSRSPDDIPILGTVGSYWSHKDEAMDSSLGSSHKGRPNTTRKYREVFVK